jgi:hypothetical protein
MNRELTGRQGEGNRNAAMMNGYIDRGGGFLQPSVHEPIPATGREFQMGREQQNREQSGSAIPNGADYLNSLLQLLMSGAPNMDSILRAEQGLRNGIPTGPRQAGR